MIETGKVSAQILRPRRAGSGNNATLILALAFLASALLPLAVRAEDPPNPVCTACHNEDGNSVVPDYPKIAGLDVAYFTKQIADFKKFKRVSEIMGPIATQIADSEIELLAAYYSKQKRISGVVTDQNLAAKGLMIYAEGIVDNAVPACGGCHGEKGEGANNFPRLAGQHASYTNTQLLNFKNQVRNNDARKVMRAIAMRMTEQDMQAVSEYITSLKGE
ncbi:MAG: c-type cytochrome [Sideroxyarcus sp.]|nr:c-type cytochrome [Sideroxyarcus sp.]